MNYTKRANLYLMILAVLTLVGTVIQAILLLLYYDRGLSLYASTAPAYLIPAVVLTIVFLSATAFAGLPGGKIRFPQKRTFENHDSDADHAHSADVGMILLKIGALILVIGAILSGFLLFYGDFPVDRAHDLWLIAVNGGAESSVKMAGNLLRISAYIGSLAAVYPAVLLIAGKDSPLPALVTVIWLLLSTLSVYFDNGAVLNDPCRSLEILGLSAAILWLIAEIKQMLGSAGRRSYAFLSFAAFGILCISAIPRLIATAAGAVYFTSRTLISVALFGIAVMIAGRLCHLRLAEPEPEPASDAEPGPEDDPNDAKEPFSLKEEIRRTIYAPDTDLFALPDADEEDEDGEMADIPEECGLPDIAVPAEATDSDESDDSSSGETNEPGDLPPEDSE